MSAPADFGFVSATWDGKDFAVIQMLPLPRKNGVPYATVNKDWQLFLGGIPIRVGATIVADPVTGACMVENGYMEFP